MIDAQIGGETKEKGEESKLEEVALRERIEGGGGTYAGGGT